MKTKQNHIKAVFTVETSNGLNMSRDKETASSYVIIDKKTEQEIVNCRVYIGRSKSSSTVYASLWVYVGDKKRPTEWHYGNISGHGSAGGWGYDKESKAIEQAINSAGIELYGTPYTNRDVKTVDFKKQAWIGGTGCHEAALLAIAYSAGFNDCILVRT